MANKRLKIENLDNLQELNAEEVFSIQGGGAELEASKLSVESQRLIYIDPENPIPYPLPVWPPYPCKPYPIKPYPIKPYPIKDEDRTTVVLPLPHCPVIL